MSINSKVFALLRWIPRSLTALNASEDLKQLLKHCITYKSKMMVGTQAFFQARKTRPWGAQTFQCSSAVVTKTAKFLQTKIAM